MDASDRLVLPLPLLVVVLAALSPDLGSDCAAELAKESPTDSAIVCAVGADVLGNTLRVDHHYGSTDRKENDREKQ